MGRISGWNGLRGLERREREKARDDWWVRREKPDVPKGASWWDRLLSGKLGRWLELVRLTLDHFPSVASLPVGSRENARIPVILMRSAWVTSGYSSTRRG